MLLALEQLSNLPFLDLICKLCRSISVIDTFKTSKTGLNNVMFESHFTTEHYLYHNWSQEVHTCTYSGLHAMFLRNIFIIEVTS